MQSRGFIIFSSLIEGSLADLFSQRLAKNSLIQTKEGLQNLAVDTGLDAIGRKIRKNFHQLQVQQETPTNKKIKDIMRVIRSLKNREILLKEATQEISSHEVESLIFFRSLMTRARSLVVRDLH